MHLVIIYARQKKLIAFIWESRESSHLKGLFGGASSEDTNVQFFTEKADELKPQW